MKKKKLIIFITRKQIWFPASNNYNKKDIAYLIYNTMDY